MGAKYFGGMLDDVGLFNEVLEEEDIQDIMTNGLLETLGLMAVEPVSKLAATWASVKGQ